MRAADFQANYLDGPGEGFFDPGPPHPASTAGGNPGTTLGAQRRWAFEQAMAFWEARLESVVTIEVDAEMNDLVCAQLSAVLGSAGPNQAFSFDPPGGSPHPIPDTWYAEALANRLEGRNIDETVADIGAAFNKEIDEKDTPCLGSVVWYYGLGDAPFGTVSFYNTVLHEIAHGLGVLTLVNLNDGMKAKGKNDVYMLYLEDHSLGLTWPDMTAPQRQASAINSGDLHWVGSNVTANSGILASGTVGSHVQLYAPSSLQIGSSVSHWDTSVVDFGGHSELMEPSATGTEKVTVTDEAMEDMGWNEFSACGALRDLVIVSAQDIKNSQTLSACRTLKLGPDLVLKSSAQVEATAAQQIILTHGFSVFQGATFRVQIDPDLGAL